MSIIAIKNNPPARYPNIPILDTKHNWYIAKVRPRQEKAFAFDLMSMKVGYYLPLFANSVKRRDNGKKRTSILPLFPSYVPFECDRVPHEITGSNRITKIIPVQAQNKFKVQLNAIYMAKENGLELTSVDQSEIQVGKQVKIIDGPCMGLTGTLIKMINRSIVVLQVVGLGVAGIHVDVRNVRISPDPIANGSQEPSYSEP